jgi:hypothetical protein
LGSFFFGLAGASAASAAEACHVVMATGARIRAEARIIANRDVFIFCFL